MSDRLAVQGGRALRDRPFPGRRLFAEGELASVAEVFERAWRTERDFGFQGECEEAYTREFCRFQGGGYADAVATGTLGIWVALKSLALDEDSDVIVSPVTDPGSISPIILQRHKPVLSDSAPGRFNVGPEEFRAAITPRTKAAILTHSGGHPLQMPQLLKIAEEHDIKIIEDCSQAHGSTILGRKVGTFGHIAVFSTMFSKGHATGGCGGIVYTKSEDLYWQIRAMADRGKPFEKADFNPKNPATFIGPALNCNADELSCAIGSSTLKKLPQIITRRREIVAQINKGLSSSHVASGFLPESGCDPFYFFHTICLDVEQLRVTKREFADAALAEGIPVNSDYRYVVAEWDWMRRYLSADASTPNAVQFRDRSFNLLFNEQFSDRDVDDIVMAIKKVEKAFVR